MGTQICTGRLSHSTLHSKEAPAEGAGEAPAMLSRRETRLFRIKVQSARKVSAGLGPQGVQGRSMGSHPSTGVRK